MDFSQFRETGELSDISVNVDGQEYNLHKFPLYIKSDFFKTLARDGTGNERDVLELTGFPGGNDTFSTVADFCYGLRVDLSLINAVQMRCAAEFLMMTGKGNLADQADRYLHDVLTSAKFSRSTGPIVDVLLQCCKLNEIAEKANVIPRCIDAIINIWLKPPTKFSNPKKIGLQETKDVANDDEDDNEKLCQLPLELFKRIVVSAREKVVWPKTLAFVVQKYISQYLFNNSRNNINQVDDTLSKTKTEEEMADDKPIENGSLYDTSQSKEAEQTKAIKPEIVVTINDVAITDSQIGEIMDELLLEIPEDTPMEDTAPTVWTIHALLMADKLKCKCRPRLVKVASGMLSRFTPSEMEKFSCGLVSEIAETACKNEKCVPEVVSRVTDTYLLELAKKKEINAETFISLANSITNDCRQSHDLLYASLEEILKSGSDLDEDTTKKIIAVIDFCRLSEETLKKAHESELVPASYITKAALDLCARMRSELDSAKAIIRMQDEDMQRFSRLKNISNGHPKHNSNDWDTKSGVTAMPSGSKPRFQTALSVKGSFRSIKDHRNDGVRSISPASSVSRFRTTSEVRSSASSPMTLTSDEIHHLDADDVMDFSSSGINSDDVTEIMNGLADLSPRYANIYSKNQTHPVKW